MLLSKKKLIVSSSIILAIFALMFLGTPVLMIKNYATNYCSGFDFMQIEDIAIKAIIGTLVCLLGTILAFNLFASVVSKIDEKIVGIFNASVWSLTLIASIASLFSKYIKVSYNPTNSLTFIFLITIAAIISSVFFMVYQPNKD